MNTKLISAVTLAAALAAPTFAFAQSANGPATRASVRAELVQLERAGYNPGTNQTDYPQNIQAAQHRIDMQSAPVANSAGSSNSGSSESGGPAVRSSNAVGSNAAYSRSYYPQPAGANHP